MKRGTRNTPHRDSKLSASQLDMQKFEASHSRRGYANGGPKKPITKPNRPTLITCSPTRVREIRNYEEKSRTCGLEVETCD